MSCGRSSSLRRTRQTMRIKFLRRSSAPSVGAGTCDEVLQAAAAAAADTDGRLSVARSASATTLLSALWSQQYVDADELVQLGSYIAMADDQSRTPLFAESIVRRLNGTYDQVVLDIGSGPFALLGLFRGVTRVLRGVIALR